MRLAVLFFFIVAIIVEVSLLEIEDDVVKYFDSATVKELEQQWLKQRKSIESAIRLVLLESFGKPRMNIYQKKAPVSYNIAKGYYLTDNVVDLLLLNLTLRDLPYLEMPDVIFPMQKNVLRLQTGLTKMFIDADYLLFRNRSSVHYDGGVVQDPSKNSPFSFQQVQTVGQMTITAEECQLIGSLVTTLIGQTVNVGYTTLRIVDCKFSVEIYSQGSDSPPVIAPYFSKEQSLHLKRLLSKPIVDELTVKIQGVLFSYINTTSIFGKDLMKFRHHQEKIFKKTSDYMIKTIRNMNKIIVEHNKGIIPLKDFQIYWSEKHEAADAMRIVLRNLSLNGLDTAYSANKGGPYNWGTMRIGESIRFNTMHLQGKIHFDNGASKGIHSFAAELQDVTVAVTMKINMVESANNNLTPSKSVKLFNVVDCRAMEYAIMNLNVFIKERITSHALVSGYIINKIPTLIVDYISEAFPNAALKASSKDDNLGVLDDLVDNISGNIENVKDNEFGNDDIDKNHIIDGKNYVMNSKMESPDGNLTQIDSKERDTALFRNPNVRMKMRIITSKGRRLETE